MNRTLRRFIDRESIVRTVTLLFVRADEGNWPAVRGCFAERVVFQSGGGPGEGPREVTPEEITDMWSEALQGLDVVHHQIGNLTVDFSGEDEAGVECYGIAFHYAEGRGERAVKTFVGSYGLHLIQEGHHWKVDGFRYHQKFVHGDLASAMVGS